MSHYNLAFHARQSGDEDSFAAQLKACYQVLDRTKRRHLHFDPQMTQVYQQLAARFGQ